MPESCAPPETSMDVNAIASCLMILISAFQISALALQPAFAGNRTRPQRKLNG
jgi:hypothetical protein